MKSKISLILFLLFASASYGQPVIDHMLIDESNGELQIIGTFGSIEGKVWVDSVEMPVKSWTDTLVIASIPDTCRGSAGSVVIGANGTQSEGRMITEWGLKIFYIASLGNSQGYEETDANFTLYWRLDIHSLLKNNKMSELLSFTGTHQSNTFQLYKNSYSDQNQRVIDSSKYIDSSYSYNGYFYPNQRRVDFDIKINVYDISWKFGLGRYFVGNCHFDSLFKLISFQTGNGQGSGGWGQLDTSFKFIFPPPPKVIALQTKPILLLPISGTLFSYKNAVTLLWDSLSLMTTYHLQVSADSVFSNTFVDTAVSSTTFALSSLAGLNKYFWRVAGINSEGESRWSDVWSFTTGLTADVGVINNAGLSLSAFPNPSSKEFNIVYTLPDRENARIALYDLEGRVIRESVNDVDAGEHSLRWDISQLPSGSYVLGLVTNRESKTRIVTIIH